MKTALIDADELVFKACTSRTTQVNWDTGSFDKVPPTSLAQAVETFEHLLNTWVDAAECDSYVLCFSPRDRNLYRRNLWSKYKAGRSEKPELFWAVDSWVKTEHAQNVKSIDGLEADDVMGLLQDSTTVVVSSDKDMLTIPGRIYNPMKAKHRLITPDRANYQWMLQTLTGDPSDGYPGCPRIGPIKAARILDDHIGNLGFMWRSVVDTFRAAGLTVTDAELQAYLAYIVRPGHYDADADTVTVPLPGRIHRLKIGAL
jgi:5'-3' exonuclease